MEQVRFLRESVTSGELEEIALEQYEYEALLNRPGSLRAKLPITAVDATPDLLDPWRSAIYAVRGTNVEWGGLLTPPSMQVGSNLLDVGCFGWLGYWDHRVIRDIVGQPEAGGVIVGRPTDDATVHDVFANPQGSVGWQNVSGGYSSQVGIVPLIGHTGSYYTSHMSVPTAGLEIHAIASVTVTLVVTGFGAAVALAPLLRIGGTPYQPGATVITPGVVATVAWTFNANPSTGLPWTAADIYAFAGTGNSTAGVIFGGPTTTFVDCFVNQITLTVSYAAGFSDFFANTDQFQIFKALIDDAQSEVKFGPGYNLGIDVVWDQLSFVRRDRLEAYRPFLAKNLGEALRQLSALDNGFDYSMQYTLNQVTNRIDKSIKLYYPFQGRDTGYQFEFERHRGPTNVIERGFADPVNFAWVGDGWGSGQADARLRSPYIKSELRGQYPPYDAAPTWNTVVEQGTLNENTVAAFNRMNLPRRVPVIRVDPLAAPAWGDYGLGDIVRVNIQDGYGSTDPAGEQWRITGWKVTSEPVFDLTLGDPMDETVRGT